MSILVRDLRQAIRQDGAPDIKAVHPGEILKEEFMSVEFWAGLQMDYDLQEAALSIMKKLDQVQTLRSQTDKKSA